MSVESVQTILGRAMREPAFRNLLFRDPGQALAGYQLSEGEMASLRGLTAENFDAMTGELEERISRATFGLDQSMEEMHKLGG